MRYGRYMGYGFYGSYILSILVILIIISLIVFIVIKQKRNPAFKEHIEILKEKYVRGEISADEFSEKKSVIEGLEVSDPVVILLVERYVKGEINSKDFFKILEQINE